MCEMYALVFLYPPGEKHRQNFSKTYCFPPPHLMFFKSKTIQKPFFSGGTTLMRGKVAEFLIYDR